MNYADRIWSKIGFSICEVKDIFICEIYIIMEMKVNNLLSDKEFFDYLWKI